MTDFEGYVLGCLLSMAKSGYAIRLRLEKSPTARWSAGSGAVYRVLRRAVEHGWVACLGQCGVANRERTEYEVTPLGREQWMLWISNPDLADLSHDCADTIAVRVEFLHLLPCGQSQSLLDEWQKEGRKATQAVAKRLALASTREQFLQYSYLREKLEARSRWLKQVESRMCADWN